MHRTLLLIVMLPFVATLALLAMSRGEPRADFVFSSAEPRTINPHRVSWINELQICAALFEGLTRLNDRSFLPEPAVAERWTISDDRRTYTFQLRPGACWSNGERVVAGDFRYAWLRVLDPKSEPWYANLFFVIEGAEAYHRSRSDADASNDTPEDSVRIDVLDAGALRVTLVRPCSYFLDLTSFIPFVPLHRASVERGGREAGASAERRDHLWTRPGALVGNGPFVLKRWEFKRALLMEKNPHYWDRDAIGVSSIEAYVNGDSNAALLAYKTGRADFVTPVDRPVAERLLAEVRAGQRSDFYTGDRFATYFYRVNTRRPPLDNADFRMALSLAIDRDVICERVMRLGETPAYTYVPTTCIKLMPRTGPDGGVIHYQPPNGLGAGLPQRDRDRLAAQRLARSGFDPRERPIVITIPAESEHLLVAEALQQMWRDALGIRVDLRTVEVTTIAADVRNLNYDVVRSNWFGDYMDPSTFLEMYTTGNAQNRTGWSNAEYDRLIAAAAAAGDDAQRFALFRRAETILVEEELPILPIFFRRGNFLLAPEFADMADNVRDLQMIHRVRRRG